MDFLIKNNIIKQNKLIVDIGMFSTKLLEINYAAKKINVTSAKIFDIIVLIESKKTPKTIMPTTTRRINVAIGNAFFGDLIIVQIITAGAVINANNIPPLEKVKTIIRYWIMPSIKYTGGNFILVER